MATPPRRTARLRQSDAGSTRSETLGDSRKRRRLLPSPSATGSLGQDNQAIQDPDRLSPKASKVPSEPRRTRKPEAADLRSDPGPSPKRRRTDPENAVERPPSTSASTNATPAPDSSETLAACDAETHQDSHDPVEHWAHTGLWPENFLDMSQEQSDSSNKRGRETSYTQSVKDGEVPKAHTRAFEGYISRYGIIMQDHKGRSFLSDASKGLCESMLSARYEEPPAPPFPLSRFSEVLARVRTRNESRIFRDITPLLVPSAELLFLSGHSELEYVAEEISADWTKGDPMGGPKPRPDFAAGISSLAFTDVEISKLQNHTAWGRATLFTDNMYFPFLVCEVKGPDQVINRADRQNAHSCSMAVNAIVQLHRVLGDEVTSQLNGQVLVFSVSHDNEFVKIYGHYAVIKDAETTFHRELLDSFGLDLHRHRKRSYDFVREVYDSFFPAHLQRITDALAAMDDPQDPATISVGSVEESGSHEVETSASSQVTGVFKVPGAPASKRARGEAAALREQIAYMEKNHQEQMAQQEKNSQEQMAQQEKNFKEQMAQQEKNSKEQTDMLRELLNRR